MSCFHYFSIAAFTQSYHRTLIHIDISPDEALLSTNTGKHSKSNEKEKRDSFIAPPSIQSLHAHVQVRLHSLHDNLVLSVHDLFDAFVKQGSVLVGEVHHRPVVASFIICFFPYVTPRSRTHLDASVADLTSLVGDGVGPVFVMKLRVDSCESVRCCTRRARCPRRAR